MERCSYSTGSFVNTGEVFQNISEKGGTDITSPSQRSRVDAGKAVHMCQHQEEKQENKKRDPSKCAIVLLAAFNVIAVV